MDNKAYKGIKYNGKLIYPVTEMIAKQGLHLPSGLTLKEEEIKKITRAIEKILENKWVNE